MGSRHVRIFAPIGLLLVAAALFNPLRCTSTVRSSVSINTPGIRVRLLQAAEQVIVTSSVPPAYQLGEGPSTTLNVPGSSLVTFTLTPRGWMAGTTTLGAPGAVLHLHPRPDAFLSINGNSYRGRVRLVPVAATKFDVVNELDVDSYLMSVVSREMLYGWHEEAFKAQAIVARTYALYEKQTAGADRHWDVYPDTRSQVYGGISSETAASRQAVADTAGVVLACPNHEGRPKIFKAYFSSCCGGVSQSAADAFGDPYIPPLSDQNVLATCKNSPRFNWGPVEIRKDELTRRFVIFGQRRGRTEQNMATVAGIQIQQANRWGRPVRFLITDVRGNRYSMTGEEFRWAVNSGATDNAILYSSFVKIINDSDRVRFVEGHGWGHGVGMCQWCAQTRAESGLRHEDILLAAFPTAMLVRGY